MVGSSNAVYIGLPNIIANYTDIVASINRQIFDGSFESYLPAGSTSPEVIKVGYRAQLTILAAELSNHASPVFESIFSAGCPSGSGYLLKPLSRGTVQLDSSAPDGEPLILYGTGANPIDIAILVSFIPFLRRYLATPTMQTLGARELYPRVNVTSAAEIEAYVRRSASGSFGHPCYTAGMLPRNKGGVLGSDLKVHGVHGLRVIDARIFLFVLGTHTSSTVHAVAEKGAVIIIREWKGK